MKVYQIKQAANEFEIKPKAALEMRDRYLREELNKWPDYIEGLVNEMPALSVDEILEELEANKKAATEVTYKDSITEEMIAQARDYPVEALIDFSKGKALAWCHEDHSPSLSHWKAGNRATCFPCGRQFNAIDILVERDGYTFIGAVKELVCK